MVDSQVVHHVDQRCHQNAPNIDGWFPLMAFWWHSVGWYLMNGRWWVDQHVHSWLLINVKLNICIKNCIFIISLSSNRHVLWPGILKKLTGQRKKFTVGFPEKNKSINCTYFPRLGLAALGQHPQLIWGLIIVNHSFNKAPNKSYKLPKVNPLTLWVCLKIGGDPQS